MEGKKKLERGGCREAENVEEDSSQISLAEDAYATLTEISRDRELSSLDLTMLMHLFQALKSADVGDGINLFFSSPCWLSTGFQLLQFERAFPGLFFVKKMIVLILLASTMVGEELPEIVKQSHCISATLSCCCAHFMDVNLRTESFNASLSDFRSNISDIGRGMLCKLFPETLSRLLLFLCSNHTQVAFNLPQPKCHFWNSLTVGGPYVIPILIIHWLMINRCIVVCICVAFRAFALKDPNGLGKSCQVKRRKIHLELSVLFRSSIIDFLPTKPS
ncbi:hypothetical protein HHK36_022627 [Tetracentron sinense]|uniref:Uncharacterized protein n=1 Tax=Tetracentron sinense TaxID=13715 RepID=A0A834YQB1_TETSI|nr:hypothetical protein HHK36_022627 [Tetracentron sinense]